MEEGIKAKKIGCVRVDSLYNAINPTSQLYSTWAWRTLFTKALRNMFTEGTSTVKKLSVVVMYQANAYGRKCGYKTGLLKSTGADRILGDST